MTRIFVQVSGRHLGPHIYCSRVPIFRSAKLIEPGKSEIEILVTNTEANQRAVGTRHHILAAIDICGMKGPVQLISYIDEMLALQPNRASSKRQARR